MVILIDDDPRLRMVSAPIAPDEFGQADLLQLAADMLTTMRQANGVGLAAPQVGVLKRLIVVMDLNTRATQVLCNPVIKNVQGQSMVAEGCLSLPTTSRSIIPGRGSRVRVEAQRTDGSGVIFTARDVLAVSIQHEVDHLDGILFPDRLANH
jgi:peptide deformylase